MSEKSDYRCHSEHAKKLPKKRPSIALSLASLEIQVTGLPKNDYQFAIENGPFIVDFPIKICDFPMSYVGLPGND